MKIYYRKALLKKFNLSSVDANKYLEKISDEQSQAWRHAPVSKLQ